MNRQWQTTISYGSNPCFPPLGELKGALYDPLIGRFLSADNNIQDAYSTQGYNRYSYCLNNPLKYTDPSGWLMAPADQFWNLDKARTNQVNFSGTRYFGELPGEQGWGGTGGYGTMGSRYYDVGHYTMDDLMGSLWKATPDNSIWGFSNVNGDWYHTTTTTVIPYEISNATNVWDASLTAGPGMGISASSGGDAFTGYKGKRYYFEGVRVRELNFGNFKYGAAMTLPGVGIFVGPGGINDVDLLKHEFGHILQARKWGADVFYGDVAPASLRYANYANGDPYYSNLDYMSNWTEWSANYLSYKYFNGNFNTTNYPISPVNSGAHIFNFPHFVNTPSEFYINWLGD